MRNHDYQFPTSVPAYLSPTQKLFRSLDGNADGQVTACEIKTSGVLMPKSSVPAVQEANESADATAQDSLSSQTSRFQYFLQMMTQAAPEKTTEAKAAPKPANTNPYDQTPDKASNEASGGFIV